MQKPDSGMFFEADSCAESNFIVNTTSDPLFWIFTLHQ